jgi:hypothetical protein
MRRIFFVAFVLLNSAIVSAQYAEFSFAQKVQKLDAIEEGTSLSLEFPFTNSGTQPLVITEYKVQCSCTKVYYPKEPILPGEKGVIEVEFDSLGKTGWQYRKILLTANTKKGIDEIEFRVKVNQ